MSKSKIEWTGRTWNPIVGCSKCSDGCKNCYAERMARRLASMGTQSYHDVIGVFTGKWNGETICIEKKLTDPLHWRTPRKIFVCSMSDLFHESVPFEFIDKVFAVMVLCPQHTFQVLTKRADRMAEYFTGDNDARWDGVDEAIAEHTGGHLAGYDMVEDFCKEKGISLKYREQLNNAECIFANRIWHKDTIFPFPNVWLGVTAENQAMWDKRYPILRRLAGRGWKHFVSIEPMLSGIEISWCYGKTAKTWKCLKCGQHIDDEDLAGGNLSIDCPECDACNSFFDSHDNELEPTSYYPKPVIICGGESGPRARPMNPVHVRDLRDQCEEGDVPFYFKQWGKYFPRDQWEWTPDLILPDDDVYANDGKTIILKDHTPMHPVGKKKAGHLLDGKEHRPEF